MPSNNSNTAFDHRLVERRPSPATALDLRAAMRLARAIESHATALRSWAGILLTRFNSGRQPDSGTLTLMADIANAMEQDATIAAGLTRKLKHLAEVS
jgi:hypothetical protein